MSKYEMRDLINSYVNELEVNKEEILGNNYPEDLIKEYADSYIPIYNYELAMYLANNLELGFEEYYTDRDYDIFDLIKQVIYNDLIFEGYNWLGE